MGSASGLGGGLYKRGTYHALKWRGGGSQSLQGKGVGISHRQQNIKTADKLLIRGGEGENHKSVTKPYGGLDKCYQDTVKIAQLPPPPPQAINSDPSQSSLMHLDRIDFQKLNFFSTLNI